MLLQAQIAKKYGRTPAEIASYIHENWLTGGQSDEEQAMDVANDARGMDIGLRSKDKADMAYQALQAIKSGQAKTIAKPKKLKKFEDGGEVTPTKSRVKENLDAIIQGVKNENVSAKDAALFINSFIPVTGDIQSAAELYQALKDKDYLGAGLSGLGLIPGLPAMGGVIKGRKWSDNPGGSWLEHKRKLAADEGMNEFGTPERMGTLTGGFDEEQTIPVSVLKGIRGMRGEQDNVRPDSIEWLTKHMSKTGKLPPTQSGKEYAPFITVDQRGIPYVNEGNHRIMVADKLGWESLPVEIRYFNGGEDMPGIMSPSSIEAMPDLPRVKKTKTKK
jgi:hypothetical protein